MKNTKIILPTLVLGLVLGGAGVIGTKYASAQYGQNKGAMAGQLAQKLNVSEDKVTGAMDQIRTENQTERKAEISTNLDKAVSEGAITAEQKQMILDEQAKREQQASDHQKWVEDSGIDWTKLKSYHVGTMGGFGGKGLKGGNRINN